jgi:hypothetical protein
VDHNGWHYLLPPVDREGDDQFTMAFHQAWLWIGLLVEVLRTYDVVVSFSDFTTPPLNTLEPLPEDNVVYLTTTHLSAYLKELAARDRSFGLQERRVRLSYVLSIFEMAYDFSTCIAAAGGLHACELSDDVALSILSLGVTLQNTIRETTEDIFDSDQSGLPEHMEAALKGFSSLKSKYLRTRFENTDWCRSDIKLLEDHLDVELIYYASMLQRKGLKRNHSGCSDDACLAHQVIKGSYETRHVDQNCTCHHITINVETVDRILLQGGVPAVKIGCEGDMRLEVVDVADASTPYICISHVWSDGLGNERSNSLPRCQLQHLQELCSKTPLGKHQVASETSMHKEERAHHELTDCQVPIWIDTLCVPLSQHRKLALQAIEKTYRHADIVLVIDLELTNTRWNAPLQELSIRAGICGWSRRLWTFQEAVLARDRLYFQFQGGAVNLWHETMESLDRSHREMSAHRRSDTAVMVFLRRRTKPFFENESGLFTFMWMAGSLLFRRTSKQRDEPFCLAAALELDTSRILRFDTVEERMREFWRMMPSIPSTIFFLGGDKLQFPGYRWAPQTLLQPMSNPSVRWRGEETTRMAQWDETGYGVRVSLPGFLIRLKKRLIMNGKFGLMIPVRKAASLAESFMIEVKNEKYWPPLCYINEFVLVVENDIALPVGFLAQLNGTTSSATSVEYICPVTITPIKEWINWECMDHNGQFWQAECVEEYGPDNHWCLG